MNNRAQGGNALKKKYGKKHFSQLGKKSYAAQSSRDPEYGKRLSRNGVRAHLAKDPDWGKKLAAAGRHARQVKKQEWIKLQLGINPKAIETIMRILSGKNTT